ncbi:MAG: hypothetical protein IJ719_12500 [Clostridia bacterium]|nr:hypothetical protein [Clostridia bacterium]
MNCFFDPATPAYVSLSKSYIGDKQSLLAVAENLESEEYYQDTVNGIRAYFDGKTDAMHTVAFEQTPVLRPVHVPDKTELVLGQREWDHINTWGFPYHMQFQSAEVSQLLVSDKSTYHRFVRARITGFGYRNFKDDWRPIGGFIMGNAAVLDIQDRGDEGYGFANLLYVCEDSSESMEEQQRKMQDPDAVVFDGICEEVFGDG